jgi:hypothetical protein
VEVSPGKLYQWVELKPGMKKFLPVDGNPIRREQTIILGDKGVLFDFVGPEPKYCANRQEAKAFLKSQGAYSKYLSD